MLRVCVEKKFCCLCQHDYKKETGKKKKTAQQEMKKVQQQCVAFVSVLMEMLHTHKLR